MGKNNRQKQGSFFKACSRSTRSISGTSEVAVLMKKPFPCFLNVKSAVLCHITVVKIDSYQTAFEDVAAILTGIECKYMSLCLVFSILPNFYEIKTNFPQNYNV